MCYFETPECENIILYSICKYTHTQKSTAATYIMLHVHNSEEMQTRHHTSKTRLETLFREINQQFHYYYFIFLFFRKILILTQLIKYRKVRSSFLPIHFKVT